MFEGCDFSDFWDDSSQSMKDYVDHTPDDAQIAQVEEELGYKLPASYIWLMKQHNGGLLRKNLFRGKNQKTGREENYVITGLLSIGWSKIYSLCGNLGSQFMIEEWGYPPVGVAIGDTLSAGHEMVFLDYRKCGPQGEPEVVWIDQENDYEITWLANDFESFIRGLICSDEMYR